MYLQDTAAKQHLLLHTHVCEPHLPPTKLWWVCVLYSHNYFYTCTCTLTYMEHKIPQKLPLIHQRTKEKGKNEVKSEKSVL